MYYHVHIKKKNFFMITFFLLLLLFFAYRYSTVVEQESSAFYPCGLKTFFHLYCPGCGGTHAVYYLFHFQFIKSLLYNPLVIYIAVVIIYYWVKFLICLISQHGDAEFDICLAFLWLLLFFLFSFCIIRNVLLTNFGIDYQGDLIKFWQ